MFYCCLRCVVITTVFPQALFSLLGRLSPNSRTSPGAAWRQEFGIYCAGVPPYYAAPLRMALRRWGILTPVVPDALDKGLSAGALAAHLRRLRASAAQELERLRARVAVSPVYPRCTHGVLMMHPDVSWCTHDVPPKFLPCPGAREALGQGRSEPSTPCAPTVHPPRGGLNGVLVLRRLSLFPAQELERFGPRCTNTQSIL